MSSATRASFYLTWFLVCLSGSDQKCAQNQDGYICDSFQELPLNIWDLQFRIGNGSNLQEFVSPNLSDVKNIVRLSISRSINGISRGAFRNFEELRYLFITNNTLFEVKADMFESSKLTNLVLIENKIKVLKGGFEKSSSLMALYLSKNLLKEVTKFMLQGLNYLEILKLDHNLIKSVESEAFSNTPNLLILSLDYNLITVLDAGIFSSLRQNSLEELYMSHNKLTFLEKNLLDRLPELRTVRIGANPWQCFCLDLILKWLDDMNVHKSCKDFAYFNGAKPLCVPTNKKECDFYHNENYYVRYHNNVKLYSQEDDCVRTPLFIWNL